MESERGGAGEQPCRQQSGVAGWQQAQYESVMYPGIQEGKPHPEVCQTCRWGAQGHGLVVDMSVLGLQLDLMILKVFSYFK